MNKILNRVLIVTLSIYNNQSKIYNYYKIAQKKLTPQRVKKEILKSQISEQNSRINNIEKGFNKTSEFKNVSLGSLTESYGGGYGLYVTLVSYPRRKIR